ncbi:uncharacterized protein [Oryctolagus cuniculus]|uniref:uncharacterized protein isoform X2 n=1 Tax=Oryctolagus cuniculus TaxID=9986 RepID=UPI00387A4BB6
MREAGVRNRRGDEEETTSSRHDSLLNGETSGSDSSARTETRGSPRGGAGRWLWRSAPRNGTAPPRVCGVFSSGPGGEVWEEGTEERPAKAGAPSVGAGSRMCHSTQDHRR